MENSSETSVPFPPTGWVTNRHAARLLGVTDVERVKKRRKPKGHPQPVWFTPF